MKPLHLRLTLLAAVLLIECLTQPVTVKAQNIYLQNTAKYDSGRYLWTVYVAGDNDTINKIHYVEYTLPDSFPKPVEQISARGSRCAFALSSNSWAEFEIKARVVFRKGEGEERHFNYRLNLLKNETDRSLCAARYSRRRLK